MGAFPPSFLLLLQILTYLTPSHSIRTLDTWNQLFQSQVHQKFQSDDHFDQRIQSFQRDQWRRHEEENADEENEIKLLFVLKYKENCGHLCHQFIQMKLHETPHEIVAGHSHSHNHEYHYEIVNINHGVLRTSLKTIRNLHAAYSNYIVDYVPFLPELKFDGDLLVNRNEEKFCLQSGNSSKETVTLQIVFTLLKSEREEDVLAAAIQYGVLQDLPPTNNYQKTSTFQSLSKQISLSILLSCSLLSSVPLSTILFYYSNLPMVHWLEIRSPIHLFTKFANSLTQIDPPEHVTRGSHNIYQLYRSMNLTGQHEIIGISDTGIDVTSCYFYDPHTAVTYNRQNPFHRKIFYYNTYIDSTDSYGHGTAVSGIAAGECVYPLDRHTEKKRTQYDSVASKAKIAFFDISGSDNSLRVPSDINDGLLQVLYANGARIMSLSWGSSTNKYSIDSRCVCVVCGVCGRTRNSLFTHESQYFSCVPLGMLISSNTTTLILLCFLLLAIAESMDIGALAHQQTAKMDSLWGLVSIPVGHLLPFLAHVGPDLQVGVGNR
jgi:hypothetical protein